MTYDQWKCTDPNEPYCDEPECDHEGFEINWEGRAECQQCGMEWWAYPNEIRAQDERQRVEARENRRQRWRDRTYPVRMFVFRMLERVWPRRALNVLHDDEIPF